MKLNFNPPQSATINWQNEYSCVLTFNDGRTLTLSLDSVNVDNDVEISMVTTEKPGHALKEIQQAFDYSSARNRDLAKQNRELQNKNDMLEEKIKNISAKNQEKLQLLTQIHNHLKQND